MLHNKAQKYGFYPIFLLFLQVGQLLTFKAIKRVLKIFWLSFVAIASIILAGILAIQLPQVQTAIVSKVVETLDDKLDAEIDFEKIHLKPFTTLVLKNVSVIDRNPTLNVADPSAEPVDTFFRADYIIARFTFSGLLRQDGLHLDRAYINGAQMNLVLEDNPDESAAEKSTDNLSRIFRLKKPEEKKPVNNKEIFHIKDVKILDMGFAMKNHGSQQTPYYGGINWNDLDIKDIDLSAEELQFKGGVMSGTLNSLSFEEKSGFKANSITGKARVGNGRTLVEDLHIVDQWSDIRLPVFMMLYENVKAFKNFISEVKLDGDLENTILDFKTLKYFAPQLEGNTIKASISGNVYGYVDNFKINNIRIATDDGGFSTTVNGRMAGIPDIENTMLDATISKSLFTLDGMGKFLSAWIKDGELDLSRYGKGLLFTLDGTAKGLLNDFDASISAGSLAGSIDADMKVSNIIDVGTPISISGNISTDDLDIGRITGMELIRQITLDTKLDVKLTEVPELNIRNLSVDRMHINGYDYQGISATGILADNLFNGWITCHDPNLFFMLRGAMSLAPKGRDAVYGFELHVGDANLNAINIDKRGKSYFNLSSNVNFVKMADGTLSGKIDITDVMLENRLGKHMIGKIGLNFHNKENSHDITFKSDFANGTFKGSAPVSRFVNDLVNISFRRELPSLFKSPEYTWNGNSYEVKFDFSNSMDLMNFIMPGMYIDENTSIRAAIDSKGLLNASLRSQRIAKKGQFVKNLDIGLSNADGQLKGEMTCDSIQVSSLSIVNDRLELLAHDDHIGARFTYDNDSEPVNKGELVITGDIGREDDEVSLFLNISPSALYVNSSEWNILESSIRLKGKNIDIQGFEMTNGDQRLWLEGSTSAERTDTLHLNLERFDISMINPLLNGHFGLQGAASGSVHLYSPITHNSIRADIICDSTAFAEEKIGELALTGLWNEEFERYDIRLKNTLDQSSNIDIMAKLSPKTRMLEAVASLNRLSAKYAEPLLKDIFSELGGSVSGNVILSGPLDNMSISSEGTRLDNAMLRIGYTNVPYFADGSFHIDDTGVYFDEISIHDRLNGTGSLSGCINWNRFRDISFDTRVKVNEIEGINLSEEMGDVFYGNIFATGNVSITGPVNSLLLNVDAVTAKQGQLHIPVSSLGATAGGTNLLKFTEPVKKVYIDPYVEMMKQLESNEAEASDFTVNIRVNTSPDIEAFVEIDKASGNVLSGRGNGLVELKVGEDLFNINGEYTLTGGSYRFAALGLVSKDFQIQPESKITFGGDIMESNLDIAATYATKASLGTLLADSTSVGNRRDILCGIQITDKLKNPRLGFSIEIPDLDPMTKARVDNALSTEDKVQKQFLSLLVTNNFLPEEQSGIANNSSSLVTDALANQLNNIFEKLDIPLDLGLKYQSNNRGTDIFDVAVSTQLFNNRVSVNGNIGNKERGSSSQSDVVGDLDIEIKIDRSGSLRLNIFSHSADQYTNYLDNSQRNGVGLSYQTEFNSLGQFIRNIFRSKAKRQEARRAEEQALLESERVSIRITGGEPQKSENGNDGK